MPEQPEGSPEVGTADMHGGGVTFKDRDGNDVSFEVVRLGTTKELETVKGALATEKKSGEAAWAERCKYHDMLAASEQKLTAASNAYSTEKEVSAELTKANQGIAEGIQRQKDTIADMTKELTTARDDLVAEQEISAELRVDNEQLEKNHANLLDVSSEHLKAMRFERDAAIGEKEALSTSCDNFKRALLEARAELDAVQEQFLQRASTAEGLRTELVAARAELEDLMTVKASLEETNTALEVSQKELCEAREACDNQNEHWREEKVISAQLRTDHANLLDVSSEELTKVRAECVEKIDGLRQERDASRQALADIKAKLLTEADRFKTILDTMAEKISGE